MNRIEEYYTEKLSCFHQEHKMLMAITLYSCSYFVGQWKELTDIHIQIAKRVAFEQVAERVFYGCEPTFLTEEAYNWWNNLSIDYFEREYEMVVRNPGGWSIEDRERIPNLDKQIGWKLKSDCHPPELLFDVEA